MWLNKNLKKPEINYIVDSRDVEAKKNTLNILSNHGIVCLRNVHDGPTFNRFCNDVNKKLESPSILGSRGYYQKDTHKRLLDFLMLGDDGLQILLNEDLINIVEEYLGDDSLLSEGFVKHDFGDNSRYFSIHAHYTDYCIKDTESRPHSIGLAHYLHKTKAGAFCYALGTHKWDTPHGADPDQYPKEMQNKIRGSMRRIEGEMGDVLIFDHRGFHAPEQPVDVSRTAIISVMHSKDLYGNNIKESFPVFPYSLSKLSQKQIRVLGVGAEKSYITPDNHHLYSFNKLETPYKWTKGFINMLLKYTAIFKK